MVRYSGTYNDYLWSQTHGFYVVKHNLADQYFTLIPISFSLLHVIMALRNIPK